MSFSGPTSVSVSSDLASSHREICKQTLVVGIVSFRGVRSTSVKCMPWLAGILATSRDLGLPLRRSRPNSDRAVEEGTAPGEAVTALTLSCVSFMMDELIAWLQKTSRNIGP